MGFRVSPGRWGKINYAFVKLVLKREILFGALTHVIWNRKLDAMIGWFDHSGRTRKGRCSRQEEL